MDGEVLLASVAVLDEAEVLGPGAGLLLVAAVLLGPGLRVLAQTVLGHLEDSFNEWWILAALKNVVKNAIICSYLASAAAGHATLPGLSPTVTPARACATVLHTERRMPAVNQSLILFNDDRNYNVIQSIEKVNYI